MSLYNPATVDRYTLGTAEETNAERAKLKAAIDALETQLNSLASASGVLNYTWFAYADSADGTSNFTTGAPEDRQYIGLAFNKTSSTASTNPADYSWYLFAPSSDIFRSLADGTVGAPGLAFLNDTDTGIYRPGVNILGIATGGAECARFTSDGKVGIGTTNPTTKLDVSGTITWSGGLLNTNTGQCIIDAGSARDILLRTNPSSATTRLTIAASTGHITPGADNTQNLGSGALRLATIYAGTGTINTSDEREKTWRGGLTPTEIAAGKQIIAELGFYQWNDAIAEKGADGARYHFGVRAQQVWSIMASNGLIDPAGDSPSSSYAFLCHDAWDGGDRYGIRPDQLALFLIAVNDARLAALEASS